MKLYELLHRLKRRKSEEKLACGKYHHSVISRLLHALALLLVVGFRLYLLANSFDFNHGESYGLDSTFVYKFISNYQELLSPY